MKIAAFLHSLGSGGKIQTGTEASVSCAIWLPRETKPHRGV